MVTGIARQKRLGEHRRSFCTAVSTNGMMMMMMKVVVVGVFRRGLSTLNFGITSKCGCD